MRAVVQRVSEASVHVDDQVVGSIRLGLLVLVGVASADTEADVRWLADKVTGLRVFEDDMGKMNLCLADVGGSVLAVSQFTLLGDCRKGRRPSFVAAARPERARNLFDEFVRTLRQAEIPTETGQFQAEMQVQLVNHGPVTLLLDSCKSF